MIQRRPDLAAVLFQPVAVDQSGEGPSGYKSYFYMPPFIWFESKLSAYYVRQYIQSAERFYGIPELSTQTLKAFDLFVKLANETTLRLDMEFKAGQIQILHNHQILHDRTGYVDWLEPERKRHFGLVL